MTTNRAFGAYAQPKIEHLLLFTKYLRRGPNFWSYYDKLGKNIPEIRRTYLSLNSLNICFYVHSINIRLCTNNYIFSNYLMLTKYLLSDNVLYFMDKDKSRKVIHNMEEAKEVLWLYHSNSMTGGHSGLTQHTK